MTPAEHQKAMKALINDVRADTGQRVWEVFTDWVECTAIALANAFPTPERAEREARYMRHVGTYGRDNMQRFKTLFEHLQAWLTVETTDALGQLYMRLDLGNDHTGQFFTPYEVSRLMAGLTTDAEKMRQHIEERGFVTAHEPTIGAGGMIIAFADRMRAQGFNPQQQLWVSGVDIDITCVHMSFTQLSLLGIPGEIIHGDVLPMTTRSVWRTPFHHLGRWDHRLKRTPTVSPALQLPPGRTEQTGLFEAVP